MALRPWVFIHNAKHNLYNTSTSSHNAFPFLLLAISSNGVRPCDSTTLDGGLQSVIASHYVNFLQYQYIPLSTPAVHPGVKVLSQHGSWIPDRSLPTSRQHWRPRTCAICGRFHGSRWQPVETVLFGHAGPSTWNALPKTPKCSSRCLPTFRRLSKHFYSRFFCVKAATAVSAS